MTELLVFLVGFGASFISGIIGGGGGFITLPFLIFLGLDPKIATATTTFGAIGISIGSLSRFYKEKDIRRDYIVPLLLISIVCGFVGPYLLFAVKADFLKKVIAALILFFLPLFLLKKNLGKQKFTTSTLKRTLGYILYSLVLTLQVAFGSGTGIGIIFILVTFFGLTMIETSATLRLPQLISSLISIVLYAQHAVLNYTYGCILMLAMILGSYLGSHTAIKSGDTFVKAAFAALAVVLAITLLA